MTFPPRVIPCLLLSGVGLVKTTQFKNPKYLGDPRNTVRIFNEKEVDELILLDIRATPENREPQFALIREIVSEAFMPIAYGGGLRTIAECQRVLSTGVEKVVLNTTAATSPGLVTEAAEIFGRQSVVVSMDVKRRVLGRYEVMTHGGRRRTRTDPVQYAKRSQDLGAGELMVNSIDRDGTMAGYDVDLLSSVTDAVTVPVIAAGGAGSVSDLAHAVREGGASAVAAGSMFVFHGPHRAVLISFPSSEVLDDVLGRNWEPQRAAP